MAAKIHTGFRFVSSDIFEVRRFIDEYRVRMKVERARKVARWLATTATNILDDRRFGLPSDIDDEKTDRHPLAAAWSNLRDREREIEKTGRRDPEIDFDFRIFIYVHERSRSLYGSMICEQPEWRRAFVRHPAIMSFAYWDNSDPPSNVTRREWQERARIWDEIFEVNRTLGGAGLVAELSQNTTYLYPSANRIMRLIPKNTARAKRLARKIGLNHYMENIDPLTDEEKSSNSSSPFMRRFFDFPGWVKGEGADYWVGLLSDVEGKLQPVTKVDLLGD